MKTFCDERAAGAENPEPLFRTCKRYLRHDPDRSLILLHVSLSYMREANALFFRICPRPRATRTDPKSREGRLRRDRVVFVVGEALTADHERVNPTCGVAQRRR